LCYPLFPSPCLAALKQSAIQLQEAFVKTTQQLLAAQLPPIVTSASRASAADIKNVIDVILFVFFFSFIFMFLLVILSWLISLMRSSFFHVY
jgi:hypothetical protein